MYNFQTDNEIAHSIAYDAIVIKALKNEDLSNLDPITTKMIIKNYDREELCNLILCDYYFLENEIKYKVGDLK